MPIVQKYGNADDEDEGPINPFQVIKNNEEWRRTVRELYPTEEFDDDFDPTNA